MVGNETYEMEVICTAFTASAGFSANVSAQLQQPLRQQPLNAAKIPVMKSMNINADQATRVVLSLPQMIVAK